MRSSGEHTRSHHLIRCLAPWKDVNTLSSTERRLISLEDQLNDMQPRFDHLNSRFDDMQSQLDSVQSRFDDLTQDITTRIGNMEQLLHKLAAAMTARGSA